MSSKARFKAKARQLAKGLERLQDEFSVFFAIHGRLPEISDIAEMRGIARPEPPATRDDGSALRDGDVYYDTTLGKLRIWEKPVKKCKSK